MNCQCATIYKMDSIVEAKRENVTKQLEKTDENKFSSRRHFGSRVLDKLPLIGERRERDRLANFVLQHVMQVLPTSGFTETYAWDLDDNFSRYDHINKQRQKVSLKNPDGVNYVAELETVQKTFDGKEIVNEAEF